MSAFARLRPDARWRDPAVLLSLVLLAVMAVQTWNLGRTNYQVDYYQFWAVGRLTSTQDDIYSGNARTILGEALQIQAAQPGRTDRERGAAATWRILQTTGTPFLYTAFGLLQLGDFEIDSAIFQLISLLVLAGALAWLASRVGLSLLQYLLLMVVLLGASFPLWIETYVGNINELQVGVLVAYLALRWGKPTTPRTVAAGALMGLAVVLKPNLALIVLLLVAYLVLTRRWRDLRLQAVGFVAAAWIAVMVSFIRFGTLEPWLGWWHTFNFLSTQTGYPVFYGNFSLDRWLRETTGVELSYPLLALLGVATIVVIYLRRQRSPAVEQSDDARWADELLLIGAGVAITLLAAPISWPHYYLQLMPLIVFLLRPPGTRFGGTLQPLVRQGLAVLALVLMTLKQDHPLADTAAAMPYLIAFGGAALLMLTASLLELRAPVRGAPVPVQASVTRMAARRIEGPATQD